MCQTTMISLCNRRCRWRSYQIGKHDVSRREPGHNAEVRQSREQKTRKKVPSKCSKEDKQEKSPSGDAPAIYNLILGFVHRGKHGCGHQGGWPDHASWSDEISAGEAGEAITKNLSRYGKCYLVQYA